MTTVELREQTRALLNETVPEKRNPDDPVRQLLEAGYLRQLGRHRRTDLAMTAKYGMTFEAFISRRLPRQKGYSWEVEQDAMTWETAIGDIATMERKLRLLRESNDQWTA